MQTAVVTGVSSGIGRAIAAALISAGWRVFGSVRSNEDAAAFERELGEHAHALVFDVTDEDAISQAAEKVDEATGTDGIALLVNNAGMSRNGPLQYLDTEDVRAVLEVNTIGVVAVTKAFLSLLGASLPKRAAPGRIINMSSVGGKIASPFMGPYCASKFALEALSDSLRRELLVYGIDVTVIEPGAIATDIWGKVRQENLTRFDGTAYAKALDKVMEVFVARSERTALPAEDLGKLVLKIVNSRRPKTRYVIQRGGPFGHYFARLLPDRFIDRAIGKQVGLLD